jgi:hypothetical protein
MTNGRKSFKIIFIIVGACFTWLLVTHFINKGYYKRIRNKPKKYAYQTYWGVVNSVLYVKDEENIDSLIAYYKKIEKGNPNPEFNFPPLSLPYDTAIYVLGYEHDSLVAKVISFYDWGKKGNFVKGYVYTRTLHNMPPPDSLLRKTR